MTIADWFLTVSGVVLATLIAYVGRAMANMPREYVPRPQVDQRFAELESRLHDDMRDQENRVEKRFDSIDSKLDKIMDKLDDKADKRET